MNLGRLLTMERTERVRLAFASVLLAVIVAIVLFAPQIAPLDPHDVNTSRRLTPPSWSAGGVPEHLLGTDHLGRDILSRTIYGTRTSFLISLAAVVISAVVGVTLGLLSGYFGGVVGAAIMRLADVQASFPFIVLAIVIIATFGATLVTVGVTLSFWGWAVFARVTQAETLVAIRSEYVSAARSLGAGVGRVILRHILPNVLSPLIVLATAAMAQVLVAESALSFLGLGVPPSVPSLGTLVGEGRMYFALAYWTITFPGVVIALMVFAVNMLGDTIRDILDPRYKH